MKFNFAHLFGGAEAGTKPKKPSAGKHKAEEDRDEDGVAGAEDDKDAEGDDEDEDDAAGEDEDKDAEGEDDKDKDAEGDDDDKDAEGDDDDKDAKAAKPKSVKQRIAAARKAGAKAERARIAGILGDKAAGGRGELALSLAMNTDMSVDQAVKALAASPKGGSRLANMAAHDPDIGRAAPAAADKRVAAVSSAYRASRGLKD
ncbi:hypothetical protein [Parvibaculum sp.]|uniref:hypothetical protein n=1 Tax=Parvibaculum sp. TaxID=2024848 RepID=UPI002628568F|nr:hypothetical protein [Parvibaculum sp.]MCW5727243.1 hypothetical protein [Parvibaculum sp.]